MVMSHLACADDPAHPLNDKQRESFQRVAAAFDDIDSSFANSAGIFLGGNYLHDLTRPGIALYGGCARWKGRHRCGRHIARRAHRAGPRGDRGRNGLLRGNADAQPRHEDRGRCRSAMRTAIRAPVPAPAYRCAGPFPPASKASIGGVRVPLIGRITMDLTLFDVTDVPDEALEDGWIELIGPNIPLDEAAKAAGTIGYELLTGLGPRYERRYLNADES
jgi:alanine racemase